MNNIRINIKEDFSDSPGARYRKDGPNSGEQFYEEILLPKYKLAVEKGVHLEINLDGVWVYPSSFVSGSFGKLSLDFSSDKVLACIVFISEDSETRKDRIIEEIKHPTKK